MKFNFRLSANHRTEALANQKEPCHYVNRKLQARMFFKVSFLILFNVT